MFIRKLTHSFILYLYFLSLVLPNCLEHETQVLVADSAGCECYPQLTSVRRSSHAERCSAALPSNSQFPPGTLAKYSSIDFEILSNEQTLLI